MTLLARATQLSLLIFAFYSIAEAAEQWRKGAGEEQLIYQGEFRAAQERNREVQSDLRAYNESNRTEIMHVKDRLNNVEFVQKQHTEWFQAGIRILWAFGGLALLQIFIPLIRRGLRTEIEKISSKGQGQI